jgi:hypothetical protein
MCHLGGAFFPPSLMLNCIFPLADVIFVMQYTYEGGVA